MKREITGSFKTTVTFKMVLTYLFAWILREEIQHTAVKIEFSEIETNEK
jgi:hypothetical protein